MVPGSTPDEAQTFQLSPRQLVPHLRRRASAGKTPDPKAGRGKGKRPETAGNAGRRRQVIATLRVQVRMQNVRVNVTVDDILGDDEC
jgi:hypothetical protein